MVQSHFAESLFILRNNKVTQNEEEEDIYLTQINNNHGNSTQ